MQKTSCQNQRRRQHLNTLQCVSVKCTSRDRKLLLFIRWMYERFCYYLVHFNMIMTCYHFLKLNKEWTHV